MKFIELTENEMVNVELLDDQHKEMAEIINKLHKELGAKFDGESKRLLKQLTEITKEHFETEERLMKQYNYVNFFSHKLEHDRFYKKVSDFRVEVETGTTRLNLEFLKSLRKWFFNHFKFNDKKCGDFLASNGVT